MDTELLTPAQAAELLGVSTHWLTSHRRRGDGPSFIRLSASKGVRYPTHALEAYIKAIKLVCPRCGQRLPSTRGGGP